MERCELRTQCDFFLKHRLSPNELCRRFVGSYCQGPLQLRCARRHHHRIHGMQPGADMMPSGELVATY